MAETTTREQSGDGKLTKKARMKIPRAHMPERDPLDPFGSFPASGHRERGQGRPTKRERRETDRLRGRRE